MIAVCPRCDTALMVLRWRELEVDICPQCRGVWLDHGELEELLAVTGARSDDPLLGFLRAPGERSPSHRLHLCPRCDQRLREVCTPVPGAEGGKLRVDRCPRGHGLWFDEGELKVLLESFPPACGTAGTIEALGEMLGPGVKS